jgi:polysaccharide biosynthesis/export protein
MFAKAGNARASVTRWAAIIGIGLVSASQATAQTPPPPGTPATEIQAKINQAGLGDMIRARMQSSGVSAEQVRRRLAALGYDPTTLDAYLTPVADGRPEPVATEGTLTAVRAVGLADIATEIANAEDERPEPPPLTEEERRQNLRVFGVEVFSRGTSEFDPVISGALPSSYALGPGDELVLVVTGDVELLHTLPVTREGFVVIPQVGQVSVNGLTLNGLRQQLNVRLGRVYSGISNGTTKFDISIARTRTNQVFISGDVTRPGSYTASPLASVLNVLYQAGGPTGNGSFRHVQIVRGGTSVKDVDLYQYLLGGNNLGDVRLETGDVVFVPVHGLHVSLLGEVARPAIYELKAGESLSNLIAFAGGLTAPAHTRRARLTRVLPPGERTQPGIDRVVMDIDLDAALKEPAKAPALRPGDIIDILAVRDEVRQTVSIAGGVWRDGTYGFRPGMKAWDLIAASDGLKPDAFIAQAQISRRNRVDGSLRTISFSLAKGPDGKPVENPELREDDAIRILSRADAPGDLPVTVDGAVRAPFTTAYEKGMTLHDAILRAGGLRRTADPVVEVSRLASPDARANGEIAQIFRVALDSSYFVSDEAAEFYLGNPDSLTRVRSKGAGAELVLRPHDRIFVRTIPDYEEPRVVHLRGEVKFPGSYTLRRKDERLKELIERAGGLTPTAFPDGFRLIRGGKTVDVDLPVVLKDTRSHNNMILLPGDSMVVPEYNAVVYVQGAVGNPTSVLYRKGADLSYYIESAGGYARNADKGRISVRHANGRGETPSRTLIVRSMPEPTPGSTVTVPFMLPEDKTDVRGMAADIAQIMAALGTVALAIIRLK